MLARIAAHRNYPQLPASPAKSPVRTPLPDPLPVSPRIPANTPFVNTIGALQDLCAENNLQEPEYIPVSDVGPPHARVFTIRCVVSNFTEDGVGTTKKQAKHVAAKKMVDKINNLIMDKLKNFSIDNFQGSESDEDIKLSNEIVKSKYCKLRKFTAPRKINLGVKLAEYHTIMRDNIDTDLRCKILEELRNLIPNNLKLTDEVIIEKFSKLEDLLSEVNIAIIMQDVQFSESDSCSKVLQLDTCPPITQIGIGKTELEAAFKALSYMISTLKVLLS
ncbi:interferon-inducible double-stranded RNA-dependent protein kinase activator A homolog B-like isoform X2 [Odontomachus brunneus]|nr:interferon-inducible double-stranded RNA-dependent protein kinase activator A homolog B-like isoform X2 [Odontomachus brunneus]